MNARKLVVTVLVFFLILMGSFILAVHQTERQGQDQINALCNDRCVVANTTAGAEFQNLQISGRLVEVCRTFSADSIIETPREVYVLRVTNEPSYGSVAMVVYLDEGKAVTGLMKPDQLDFGIEEAPFDLTSQCSS